MVRLFAAILIPPEVEAHLDEWVDGIRSAHPELRWVPSSRWHVTLEFMGECGPREVARQTERWSRRAHRSAPMRLQIVGGGAYPRTWGARVLWAGLGGDVDSWRRLAAHGQPPHLTLARTRDRQDLTDLVLSLASYDGPSWEVSDIALVESRLPGRNGTKKPDRGPRYVPLEYLPLG